MLTRERSINLLPQEEFEASTLGRALRWTITTFRYIVMATEMVVMGAFLSRFWLDAKNSDLNDILEVKTAQISAQSDFEKDFRSVQDRLKIFRDATKGAKFAKVLTEIAAKIPADVNLESISLQPQSGQIKGVASSEVGIAQLMANLKADPDFGEVTLNQLGSSQDNSAQTVFDLKVIFK